MGEITEVWQLNKRKKYWKSCFCLLHSAVQITKKLFEKVSIICAKKAAFKSKQIEIVGDANKIKIDVERSEKSKEIVAKAAT